MKRILMVWLALVSMLSAECQDLLTAEDYFKKSRNRRIAAWSMIGLGLVTTGAGIVMNIADPDLFFGGTGSRVETEWVPSLGIGIVVGSIPFFISARKYRNMAIGVSFNHHKNSTPGGNFSRVNKKPLFSVKFSF